MKIKLRQCYIKDNLCYIPLNNGQEAFTDKDYFNKISKYNWHLCSRGFIRTTINSKHIFLNNFLFSEIKSQIFINKNKLDCRKENIKSAIRACYIKDNICYIPLNNGKIAICDADRFDEVNNYNWYLANNGYATTTTKTNYKKENITLHRFLYPEWKIIDHKNRNKLDNTSINLREVTPQQNLMNRFASSLNKSGYKGVTKQNNKWRAKIIISNKQYHLGYHDTPEQAALAYNEKAKELFGEYAYLNVIGENK